MMITLLAKCFIQNRDAYQEPSTRQSYGMLCSSVGIFLNICLFAGKFVAGLLGNSIAITADAFNNLSDAGSSVITLIGFRMAGQKPDPDHPFGHGRIEYIAGLLVSVIILLMGAELVKTSADKILHPEELVFSPLVLVILLLSILVKCYMYLYNRSLGRKLDSAAMKATATDSLSDTIATTTVLLCTLVAHFTGLSIDGWCGVLVGLFICYSGFGAARDTISPLLGQAPDKEFVNRINEIVMGHSAEGIQGIHDLIVHNYGPGRVLISLHAEVPAYGNLLELHELIDTIERELKELLHCHAVIHMDPVCIGDAQTEHLKNLARQCLARVDASLTLHDFRIVSGPTRTNLIFDVVTPHDFSLPDDQLVDTINRLIQQDHPNYTAVIDVDKQMV